MTEREARKILLRAAEAGAFEELVRWYDGEDGDAGRPPAMDEELRGAVGNWGEIVSRWLTRRAEEIATSILGEPFEFPSFHKAWMKVERWMEDPLWSEIMSTNVGNDADVEDGP